VYAGRTAKLVRCGLWLAVARSCRTWRLIVRDHGSLVDALRAAKEHLQISNETLEALAGLCAGHVDKLFNGEKRVGPLVLGLVCEALGIEFIMRENRAAVQKLAHRWERRDERQVREPRTVSQAAIDRCRPIILSEMARKGWATRRASNGNGHAANGHVAK
jgi:hypothetical protein